MRPFLAVLVLIFAACAFGQEAGPQLLKQVPAEIPAALQARGVTSGRAQVTAEVDAEGRISDCLVTAATDPGLVEPTVAAVRQWVFDPKSMGEFAGENAIMDLQVDFGPPRPDAEGPEVLEWAYQIPDQRNLDHIPVPLRIVRPSYPAAALAKAGFGEITVDFYIDRDGDVRMPNVTSGINPKLDKAAIAAVAKWKFAPPLLHNRPVDVHSQQTFLIGAASHHGRPLPNLRAPAKVAEYQMPGPLYGTAAVNDGNAIYLVGGQGNGPGRYLLPYILRFDLQSHAFSRLAAGKFIPRVYAGAVLADGKIYIIGGYGLIDNVRRSMQIYDIATGTMTDGPPPPSPRAEFAIGLSGRKIIMAGGDSYLNSPTGETDVYDLDSNTWRVSTPMPRPASVRGTIVPYNGRLFVAGGYYLSPHMRYFQRAARVYHPDTGRWSRRPPLFGAMYPSAIEAVGRYVYIFGNYQNLIVYDIIGGRSAEFAIPSDNGYYAAATTVGNRIYLIGGTLSPRRGLSSREIQVFQVPP